MGTISRASASLALAMAASSSGAPCNTASVLHNARNRRDAAKRNPHLVKCCVALARDSGKTDLRYRLRFSGTDFAVVMLHSRARQTNARQQLFWLISFVCNRCENPDREPTRRAPNQFQFGVVSKQRGGRVGGRRSVNYIAAQRAAVLNCQAAGFIAAWQSMGNSACRRFACTSE